MNKTTTTVTRKTTESEIIVTLTQGTLSPDYRKHINTPIMFLNHMLEHIAYRSGVNLDISVTLDKFDLTHVVAEDVGMTFGKAVLDIVNANVPTGYGDAIGIIDEAKASVAISFEGRALFDFTFNGANDCGCLSGGECSCGDNCACSRGTLAEQVEGMYTDDLLTFLDGFAQGASATLHVDILKGKNGHHIWEAAFRAIGTALGRALHVDEARAGLTAGVAGAVTYEIK